MNWTENRSLHSTIGGPEEEKEGEQEGQEEQLEVGTALLDGNGNTLQSKKMAVTDFSNVIVC